MRESNLETLVGFIIFLLVFAVFIWVEFVVVPAHKEAVEWERNHMESIGQPDRDYWDWHKEQQ